MYTRRFALLIWQIIHCAIDADILEKNEIPIGIQKERVKVSYIVRYNRTENQETQWTFAKYIWGEQGKALDVAQFIDPNDVTIIGSYPDPLTETLDIFTDLGKSGLYSFSIFDVPINKTVEIANFSLQVFSPPRDIKVKLLHSNNSRNLQSNQTYVFQCQAKGFPHPEFEWEFATCPDVHHACKPLWQNLQNVSENSLIHGNYQKTTEMSFRVTNVGKIRCIANSSGFLATSEELDIIPSDISSTELNDGVLLNPEGCLEVLVGSSVNLTCQMQKTDFLELTWSKKASLDRKFVLVKNTGSHTIYRNLDKRHKAYFDSHSSRFSHKFTIGLISISKFDEGKYYCLIQRKTVRKLTIRQVHIIVKDPLDVREATVLLNSDISRPMIIPCKVSGWTPDKVIWYKDNKELNFTQNGNLKFAQNGLEISGDRDFNHGEYVCESHANQNDECKYDRQIFKLTKSSPNTYWSVIWGSIGAVYVALVIILVVLYLMRRRRSRLSKLESSVVQSEFDPTISAFEMLTFRPDYSNKLMANMLVMTRRDMVILGEGNFGAVIQVQLKKPDGTLQPVALKRPKSNFDLKQCRMLYKELCLMTHLTEHPNIVHLIGFVNNISRGQLYIVMELCLDGSLLKHLRSAKDSGNFRSEKGSLLSTSCHLNCATTEMNPDLDEAKLFKRSVSNTACSTRYLFTSDLISYAYQIASAFEYLSSIGLIHRNLSATKILLCHNFQIAKVSGFGLSILSGNPESVYIEMNKEIITPLIPLKWSAPESIIQGVFSIWSDVWSFGILLGEIFSLGGMPFCNTDFNPGLLLSGELKPPNPAFAPDNIHKLILSCCMPEPKSRISFEKAKQDLVLEFLRFDPDQYQELLNKLAEIKAPTIGFSNDVSGRDPPEGPNSTLFDIRQKMFESRRRSLPMHEILNQTEGQTFETAPLCTTPHL